MQPKVRIDGTTRPAQFGVKMWTATVVDSETPIFIVGCPNSGTDLLGAVLAQRPEVSYRDEPYDLWAAVDPITDVLHPYSYGEHHCVIDRGLMAAAARDRFRCLMSAPKGSTHVETSRINTLRIGYLDSLASTARYIRMLRDGLDVVNSIPGIAKAANGTAFQSRLNQSRTGQDLQWATLELDRQNLEYYPKEVQKLTMDSQRSAYEWPVSLREWHMHRGFRLVELRYQDLADFPEETLQLVIPAMRLTCSESWLRVATAQVAFSCPSLPRRR